MLKKSFYEFCADMRKLWTPEKGAVALITGGAGTKVLRICMGPHRNPGHVARKCVVWAGEEKLYDGLLETNELRLLLARRELCHVELTTSWNMTRYKRGQLKCYPTKANCDPALCKILTIYMTQKEDKE